MADSLMFDEHFQLETQVVPKKKQVAQNNEAENIPPAAKKKKRAYTSRYKRNTKAFRFSMQERDFEVLVALNIFKFLSVSMIHKLCFRSNSSNQSCLRRLKLLYHSSEKLIGRVTPLHANGGSPASAYYLDEGGKELLKENGIKIRSNVKSGNIKLGFLNHAIDVSSFVVYVKLALENTPLCLDKCIFDYEMKTFIENAVGNDRYKLYSSVIDPLSHQSFTVYLDILIGLKGRVGSGYEEVQKLFFVEIDRGTMGIGSKLIDKLTGYEVYRKEKIFQKFGKYVGFLVLLQTSSTQRVENIRRIFSEHTASGQVLITDVGQVDETSVLHGKIWLQSDWQKISIMKT